MNKFIKCTLSAAAVILSTQVVAQVVFYENDDFQGRTFSTQQSVANLARSGFNDRASSVVVLQNRWEVCEDTGFGGRCAVLRQGRYRSLAAMGLNDRVSSVRTVQSSARVEDDRYAPAPIAVYDNHRRKGERVFQADITSVRAVMGTPQQRCWVEREQVGGGNRSQPSVPGALVGAVIGGILGHQVGGGTGRDLATVGGVVAGGVVGANVGRSAAQPGYSHDVQRCENVAQSGRPDYWDVTYNFRGREHRMQMTTPPGATVTVNRQGEPRA